MIVLFGEVNATILNELQQVNTDKVRMYEDDIVTNMATSNAQQDIIMFPSSQ